MQTALFVTGLDPYETLTPINLHRAGKAPTPILSPLAALGVMPAKD